MGHLRKKWPFVAAAILAYICNPLVARLCAAKLPRALAVVLVMLGLLLSLVTLLLIILPLLEKEIGLLFVRMPVWLDTVRTSLLPSLQQWLGVSLEWDSQALKNALVGNWQANGGTAAKLMPWLKSGGTLITQLIKLLLVPVAMFYLLRDWEALVKRVDALVPRHWHAKVTEIVVEVDRVLAEFLRGQLSVMLIMSVYYVLVLWLVGLDFALPIGIVAGNVDQRAGRKRLGVGVHLDFVGKQPGCAISRAAAFAGLHKNDGVAAHRTHIPELTSWVSTLGAVSAKQRKPVPSLPDCALTLDTICS